MTKMCAVYWNAFTTRQTTNVLPIHFLALNMLPKLGEQVREAGQPTITMIVEIWCHDCGCIASVSLHMLHNLFAWPICSSSLKDGQPWVNDSCGWTVSKPNGCTRCSVLTIFFVIHTVSHPSAFSKSFQLLPVGATNNGFPDAES